MGSACLLSLACFPASAHSCYMAACPASCPYIHSVHAALHPRPHIDSSTRLSLLPSCSVHSGLYCTICAKLVLAL